MNRIAPKDSRIAASESLPRIADAEPRTPFTPSSTPFGPLLSGLKLTVRSAVTTGLTLLMLAQGLNPSVAAAQTGAARIGTEGAPITWVAGRSGPSLERYEAARATMERLEAANAAVTEARFALTSAQGQGPILEAELAEAEAALAAWVPADTTGLESWDVELALEDAASDRAGREALVAEMTQLVEAHPAKLAKAERDLAVAQSEVTKVEASLAKWGAEARAALTDLGLEVPASYGDAYVIGQAVVAEAWEAASGRPVSDLAPYERSWLLALGSSHPGAIDDRLASFEAWPSTLLRDVEAIGTARTWSAEGAQRADRVAAALDYTPTAIDVAALGRWDDAEVDRMIERARALEGVGLEWTRGLRTSPYPQGPSAMTDFTVLLGFRSESETVRFWIEPPTSFSARFVDVPFDALVAGAKDWVDAGRRLTVDALPAIAVKVKGGPDAARLDALLARAELSKDPLDADALANLATIDRIDDTTFARLDAVAERFGRKLTMPEIASLCADFTAETPTDFVPSAEAIANAQRFDPGASLDDVYVWSVAKPKDRDALIEAIGARLDGAPHAHRSDRAAEYSEAFGDHVDRLSTSDLMRIDALLDALDDPSVRAAVLDQIAADVANENSELGGVFVVEGGAPRFVPLAPDDAAASNNEFAFPSAVDPYAAIVTVHLHAVGHTEGTNAGPSSAYDGRIADRGVSRSTGKSDLVIADLGDGRFGADYYTPEGAVVDLGVFTR